jgi:MFS family permease
LAVVPPAKNTRRFTQRGCLRSERVSILTHDPYAALRLRDYRFYLLGTIIGIVDGQAQSVAVGWCFTSELTRRWRCTCASAFCLAHAKPMRRAGNTLLLSVAGFGLATIVFGLSHTFWLSWAMLFCTGACDNVSVVVRQTLVQLRTPDALRGRVSAVNSLFIGTSNSLGGFESGLVAHLFSPVVSAVAGGVGTILVVIGVAARWPQLRQLRDLGKGIEDSAR